MAALLHHMRNLVPQQPLTGRGGEFRGSRAEVDVRAVGGRDRADGGDGTPGSCVVVHPDQAEVAAEGPLGAPSQRAGQRHPAGTGQQQLLRRMVRPAAGHRSGVGEETRDGGVAGLTLQAQHGVRHSAGRSPGLRREVRVVSSPLGVGSDPLLPHGILSRLTVRSSYDHSALPHSNTTHSRGDTAASKPPAGQGAPQDQNRPLRGLVVRLVLSFVMCLINPDSRGTAVDLLVGLGWTSVGVPIVLVIVA
nr:hypothetical protein [Micromonospora kangleipakensis]